MMKTLLKKMLNINSYKNKINRLIKPVYFVFIRPKVECNICGWKDFKFDSDKWHPHTICPNCNSQVRHRLFWAGIHYCQNIKEVFSFKGKRVLHFAPDRCLEKEIRKNANEYISADYFAEGYSYQDISLNIDMANMQGIEDGYFDIVMAFDVLEHVKDHLKAIEETNRVLKLGGFCIFTVPQKDNLEKTYEDLSLMDYKERELKFGQWDHWRIYGNDFIGILESRGFEVSVLDHCDFDNGLVYKYVLYPPVLSSHPLATNNRKVFFCKKVNHTEYWS
jgi:SAM-dependent methyltransferase